MPHKRPTFVAVVVVVAAIGTMVHVQTDQKKFDPYSQDTKVDEELDPYQRGVKVDNRFDLYSRGANKNDSAVNALNPGAQPTNVEKGKYDAYAQDAKADDRSDPYSQSAKTGGKFDSYNEGANKKGALKR